MYRTLDECLACGAGELQCFADLGAQPPANDLDARGGRREFPLAVNVCRACWHCQLTVSVDRALLFEHYPYVSGTTRTLDDYFAWFAALVDERRERAGAVLDIGCNDGSQLVHFTARGWRSSGVDPAANIEVKPAAEARVVRGFWSDAVLDALDARYDVLVAQNVLAHTDDPLAFLRVCRRALAPGGRVYVQTSQADMVETRQFDTIYHEHISFFSASSMKTLAARAGFAITGVWKPEIHGVSYLFELATEGAEDAIDTLIAQEHARGRYATDLYDAFGRDMAARAQALRETIGRLRARGYAIVGYGAAAKASTFLNYARFEVEYIADDNPLKHGKHTPGTGALIRPPSALGEDARPLLIVVLAWNFFDEIVERVRRIRTHGDDLFVRYFPRLEVVGTVEPNA